MPKIWETFGTWASELTAKFNLNTFDSNPLLDRNCVKELQRRYCWLGEAFILLWNTQVYRNSPGSIEHADKALLKVNRRSELRNRIRVSFAFAETLRRKSINGNFWLRKCFSRVPRSARQSRNRLERFVPSTKVESVYDSTIRFWVEGWIRPLKSRRKESSRSRIEGSRIVMFKSAFSRDVRIHRQRDSSARGCRCRPVSRETSRKENR